MFMKHNAPNRCEPRIEVIVKMQRKGPVGEGGGVQGGCEPRIEVIVKMKKKLGWGGGGGGPVEGGWVGREVGRMGGCEPKIGYCENETKSWWGSVGRGWGSEGRCEPRIDVILKMQQKSRGGGRVRSRDGREGVGVGWRDWGCRLWGCEQRIEGIVKKHKGIVQY